MLDHQYVAGLFDGEGSVILARHSPVTHSMSLVVQIVNQCREVLEEVKETYGGAIYGNSKGVNKPVYAWKAYTTGAESFLKSVLPFVRIKRRQVEIGLEFRQVVAHKTCRQSRLALGEIARREALRTELRLLNAPCGKKYRT